MVAHLSALPAGTPRRTDRDLDRLYLLPNEFVTLDDWLRARNRDLADIDDAGLGREDFRLKQRRAYETDPARAGWLDGRRAAIRDELNGRRSALRRSATPDPATLVWGRSRTAASSAPARSR